MRGRGDVVTDDLGRVAIGVVLDEGRYRLLDQIGRVIEQCQPRPRRDDGVGIDEPVGAVWQDELRDTGGPSARRRPGTTVVDDEVEVGEQPRPG